ncbi:MAG: head-tail connector protein [Alphaproteobacteria bacterium]|nr:head-tail connector protein [Alphaproteobacteria bacterium]
MTDRTPQELVLHWNKLKAERAQFERTWQEIADYVRPLRAEFTTMRTAGDKRHTRIYDSTPLMAADSFAGGIYGMMTNPANRWFALRLQDDELNDYDPVRDWLYEAETRILHSFGPQVSRFYSVLPSMYADLACFGTAIFYSEEIPGQGRINDNVRPLSECVISESAYGDVDTVYRRFALTGKQAIEMFGEALSERTARVAEKDPFCLIHFIHGVYPNLTYKPDKLDAAARPFLSTYVEEESRHKVAEGGYYEMPYHVPRWAQAAGEVYGRGIGEQVLPDVKMLNRMDETAIRAAQKIADPPLAAADEGVIKAAHTWPGGITYGAIDQNGQQLLRPLMTGGNVGITLEMMEQRRNAIKESFYFSLMQMIGSPNMTATEWMGRQEEKLRLLGPNLGRIQSEFLSPLIKRRFGLLLRANQLPPPPEEIQGAAMTIEYVSPLARAQMAGEAQAVSRLYQSLGQIAQVDPSVLDNVDHDEAVQVLGRGWAVPAKIMRGSDQVKEMRKEREQAQAMQQSLAMGAQGADVMKKVADSAKSGAQAGEAAIKSGQQPMGAGDVAQALEMLRGAMRGRPAA